MFKHPGRKLQSLAILIFALIVAISGIYGIVTVSSLGGGLFSILLVVIVCILVGWLSSITMYALGTLVDDVEEIKNSLNRENGYTLNTPLDQR